MVIKDAVEENVDPMEEEKDGPCPTISAVVNCGSTLEGEEVVEESLMGVEASEDARIADEDTREAPSTPKSQPAGSLLEKVVAKMTKKQCGDPIGAKQGVKKMGTSESRKLKRGRKGRKLGKFGNSSFMSEGSSSSEEEETQAGGMAEKEGNNLKASEIAAGGAEKGPFQIILEEPPNHGGNFDRLKGFEACKNLPKGQPGVNQRKQTRIGGMSSCSADGPTPAKKRARFDENVEKEVPASTEAYFAFLDASWREEALKNPQLTPKGVQV